MQQIEEKIENKPQVPYADFIEFKNAYLRDSDPLLTFGKAFCAHFKIKNGYIEGAVTTASARVRIEECVEWVS